ncbi:MAG: OsmC family protein [Acidimicrobiia bacterium]|nr:OsmC family protein [Acidimicrobiia bacterium]
MAIVTADLTEGFAVALTNGRHTWHADEPIDLGGTDTGPNPYELLLGSVAACSAITLSMYAQRKGIDVTSISVQYHYEKVHADDCGFCDDETKGFIETVRSEVFIEGSFTDAQRTRLAEVATRCPVHKTLERGIVFDDNVYVG